MSGSPGKRTPKRSMRSNLFRDLDAVESVQRQFAPFLGYMQAAQATLLTGRPERGPSARRVRAAIGHALAFTTWRSLVREQGCTAKQAADMMSQLARTDAVGKPRDGR